ncbi:MAG: methyltransferase domain-containing protein [Gammaproteobacteria bacterium]|nr:methyltransferase domain-containing protein [Gammaproteobacteria bacterium]
MSDKIQSWDPEQYRANAGYVADLGRPVLDLLAPQPGERILDLGCGDGTLTSAMGRLGCDVIGIDASEDMVEAARSAGVEAICGDGASLDFVEEFDAVFSNATLHWIRPPDAPIGGVCRALRPGGRFVGEFGGSGNVATIISAVEEALARRGVAVACPWFFPTAEEYTGLLERAGLRVEAIELFPRPTQLPGNIRGWLTTFAQHYLGAVPEVEREGLLLEVIDDLRGKITDEQGNWFADYVRLRFSAKKPTIGVPEVAAADV